MTPEKCVDLLFSEYTEKVRQEIVKRAVLFDDDIKERKRQMIDEANPIRQREIQGIIDRLESDKEKMFNDFHAAEGSGDIKAIVKVERELPGAMYFR